ncbi:MAG: glycoside hydrolase family 99-like domain-containing protein [Fibrobacter sp.]|nr:glycoside hydrolase family 99-like domain-containing protein [Fibrobacter sp.]
MSQARLIAIYLPQYYPIPENDETWGKGFTEWTNVGKAKPLFKGHYQPRVPADLGYYDLRVPETREAQAQMAKKYGVEGFMYWHYWFGNGKRLLERPFDEVLESGKPDFPFCLGWANHSWTTKTWTATGQFQSNKMIAEQLYPGDEDYINHFSYCLKAFKDSRYIKVDGKPFYLIYSPKDIPDVEHFISLWNDLAKQNGFPGIHFVALASGQIETMESYLDKGFDAIAPAYLWRAQESLSGGHLWYSLMHKLRDKFHMMSLEKFDYKKAIKYFTSELDTKENVYPSAIPQWDRSPRSGRQAVIYYGSTPEVFKEHLKDIKARIKNKKPEHQIVLLRSWNEWGEGNYFEPDLKYGTGFLEAVKEVFEK